MFFFIAKSGGQIPETLPSARAVLTYHAGFKNTPGKLRLITDPKI